MRQSGERVRHLLLKSWTRFSRAKLSVVSNDPEYDIKRRHIKEILVTPPKRTIVLFQDETKLHLNPCIKNTCRGWTNR